MASLIKSVSLSEEESFFLQDYNLSPTQLLKEKIWEMKGMLKNLAETKIQKMAGLIASQAQRIEQLENAIPKEDAPQE